MVLKRVAEDTSVYFFGAGVSSPLFAVLSCFQMETSKEAIIKGYEMRI